MSDTSGKPPALDAPELLAHWTRACADPYSPGRFEMTQYGELVWKPPSTNRHRAIISWVCERLTATLGGYAFVGLSVLTAGRGIRVPDIVWLPKDRMNEVLTDMPLSKCPPVVVMVCLPKSYKPAVMNDAAAYLHSGALDVFVVEVNGNVTRYHHPDHDRGPSGLSLAPPRHMF